MKKPKTKTGVHSNCIAVEVKCPVCNKEMDHQIDGKGKDETITAVCCDKNCPDPAMYLVELEVTLAKFEDTEDDDPGQGRFVGG